MFLEFLELRKLGLSFSFMERKNYEDFELRLIEKHLRPTARVDFQSTYPNMPTPAWT
ncbi:MAG: hypothetical protein ABDH29_03205 [Aquificaceae bacterium]